MLRSNGENFRSSTLSTSVARVRTFPAASKNCRSKSNSTEVSFTSSPSFFTIRFPVSNSRLPDMSTGGRWDVLSFNCHPDLRRMAEMRATSSRGLKGFR